MTDNSYLYEYFESFQHPVEADFFNPDQIKKMEADKAKMEVSKNFAASITDKPDFEALLNKAIVEGRIFSPSQYQIVKKKFNAYNDSEGERLDLSETLVSPSGQRIIMSLRLQNLLGYVTDGYITDEEIDKLTEALEADGVPAPLVDKVTLACKKYKVIILQRGVFASLKSLLEDAIGKSLVPGRPGSAAIKSGVPVLESSPKSFAELPISFVEYLKNTDKDYDRVEHEIGQDELFQEFFANLKSHYAYYKKLSTEKMIAEMVVRPQLWIKLSPDVKAKVQDIVERNRERFLAKVQMVASASHAEKLEELKKSLGK